MSNSKGVYKNVPKSEKKYDPPEYEAPRGFGARHMQVLILFISLSVGFTIKSHLSVAMVAMTSHEHTCIKNISSGNETNGFNATSVGCDREKNWSVFQTYDWNKKQQEMTLFAFFVGYTTMMLPMGILAQKFGGKIPIMVGLAVNGVTSIITPWIPHFAGWIGVCVCRLLQGATQAAFYPSIHAMLGKWAPLSERGRLSTYVYTGSQFGTIISFQVSGFFCGSPIFGWPSSFWLWGGLALVCFCMLAQFGSASPQQHPTISTEELAFIMGDSAADAVPKKRPTPWKHILTSPAVWALITAHAGSAVGYLFILTQLPLYMNKVLGVDIKNNGLLSSLPYISMYFMAIAFGNLTDFLKNRNYMSLINIRRFSNTVGMVLSSIFLLWTCYVNTTWLAVTLLVISMGLHSGVHTGFHINQIDLAPNFAGPMMGLGNMVANLSGLSIPFLVSSIVGDDVTNHHKWQITFIVMVVLQVVTNMVFVIFAKADLQQWNFYGDDENEGIDSKEMYLIKNNTVIKA
ncbi:putative inorganic phosphate cotransporter [Cydia splendana]|uniref:putative inorganic phosphate cotransporter n=1 Tax=Cydia splendana TaxID=1100963 RepID=UPI002135AFAC